MYKDAWLWGTCKRFGRVWDLSARYMGMTCLNTKPKCQMCQIYIYTYFISSTTGIWKQVNHNTVTSYKTTQKVEINTCNPGSTLICLHRLTGIRAWMSNCIALLLWDIIIHSCSHVTWWRHQMETFSALLAICAGNSPVTVEFPAQRPVTRSFDVFFNLRIYRWVNNREAGDLRRHPAHYDVIVMNCCLAEPPLNW